MWGRASDGRTGLPPPGIPRVCESHFHAELKVRLSRPIRRANRASVSGPHLKSPEFG
jgi:hypothetical protein